MPILRRIDTALALAASLALAACSGGGGAVPPHPVGATAFTSPPPAGPARASGGAPVPGPDGAASPAAGGTTSPPRAVEEADIYRLSGSTLYVLNAYRGLQILDLADVAHPRLLSRVQVTARPVDLYLRGTTALVVVSDYFSYLPLADGSGTTPRRGSRLLAVDVSNPTSPRVAAELPVDGEVEETRIVGDVLYVVSRRSWWTDLAPAAGALVPVPGLDTVFVASFDLAGARGPRPVDRLELPAGGWDIHAAVTSARVVLAFAGWEADGTGAYGPVTHFQAVDISDPGGRLAAGAAFSAAGLVRDRWGLDQDEAAGLFRAVMASGWNTGAVLQIWSAPTPGEAKPLSRLPIDVPETLTAARFDGPRVYLVTARAMDPLWAVDAGDPSAPFVAGQLAMPGQLDFVEPRGDRLVALGHTAEAGQPFQLAVSLLDVGSLANPRLLARVIFGSSWGWLGVSPDDLRKAFLVFDPPPAGIGLVLVPLQGWDAASYAWAGGTQLVDVGRDSLALRGFLAHPGAVTRAFPVDAIGSRLAALSDQALQTIDASDRDAPAELARLDLARPVSTLAVIRGAAVELSGDWFRGALELAVVPALDPDSASPLARVPVAAPGARMFVDGTVAWLLARDWSTNKAWLQAVDLADPPHPRLRGRLEVPPEDAGGGWPGWWGWGDEAVRVGHALAIHRQYWVPGPLACATCGGPSDQVRVYDLADPDAPRFAAAVELKGSSWSWGLRASGSFLWLAEYQWRSDGAEGRYLVDRIDLSDPSSPVLLARVNVPGIFFAASADGARLYTLETFWEATGNAATTWMHGLELTPEGKARLYGSARLRGYPSGAAAGPTHAWAATGDWDGQTSTTRLSAVDLTGVSLASEQEVQGSWAWLALAAGGKLFLQAGWQDQGILVYGLADPGRPDFELFRRTPGWVWDIVVAGTFAYLPSGPYGVPMIPLDVPRCAGIAGLPCPAGMACVDDPTDTCDPDAGGADCGGVCIP